MPNIYRGLNPGVRASVFPNVRGNVLSGENRGLGISAFRQRVGRLGRRGFGGSALGAAGLGLSLVDDLPYPPPIYDGGYGDEPGIIPGFAPPSCVRPLVIKVGQGLRRRAKTRVVYGSPPGCGQAYER